MSTLNAESTLTFFPNEAGQPQHYRLKVIIGEKHKHEVVVDTGSTGILVPYDLLPQPIQPDQILNLPAPVYSSSQNSYDGEWVKTTVDIMGANGVKVSTKEIAVFGVKGVVDDPSADVSNIGMMGIGFHSTTYQNKMFNPLVNLNDINGRQGYIIDFNGLTIGFDDAAIQSYSTVTIEEYTGIKGNFKLPKGSVKLGDKASDYSPLENPTRFLVDTGINYMILTAEDKRPDHYEETETQPYHFTAGLDVALTLPDGTNGSDTSFTTQTGVTTENMDKIDPAYVRWGISDDTIINTGRHLTFVFSYLFDPKNSQIGFKKIIA